MKHYRINVEDNLTRSRGIAPVALLAVLAAIAAVLPATALAAPSANSCSDRPLSTSATANHFATSREIPTLTNDVGQPSSGAGLQLPLGIGLVAVGLLGLVYGLTTQVTTSARDLTRHDARPRPAQRTS